MLLLLFFYQESCVEGSYPFLAQHSKRGRCWVLTSQGFYEQGTTWSLLALTSCVVVWDNEHCSLAQCLLLEETDAIWALLLEEFPE